MWSRYHIIIVLTVGLIIGCDRSPRSRADLETGLGSIRYDIREGDAVPAGADGMPVEPLVSESFSGPIPTSDWWTSLLWPFSSPYSEDLYAHPLALRADSTGLGIRYPTTIELDDSAYFFDREEDLHVGPEDVHFPDTRVGDHGDWTVRAEWSSATVIMTATFGHGLPFVYLTVSGAPLHVRTTVAASIWFSDGPVTGLTVNGHHYGVFAAPGSFWISSESGSAGLSLVSSIEDGGYYSVAVLPDSARSTLSRFESVAFDFVEDSRVSWQYDERSSTVRTTFELISGNVLDSSVSGSGVLTALYPHQWLHVQEEAEPAGYISPRGPMHLFQGNQFVVEVPFTGVLPNIPSAPDDASGHRMVSALLEVEADAESFFSGPLGRGDTYWTGKALGRLAELAGISHDAGLPDIRDRFLDAIQMRLETWFTADESPGYFYYDMTWNTLIGYPASYGTDTDLNDHHFHYGYFIVAAATLIRHRPDWALNWGPMVELLIADVVNPDRLNEDFPFLRTFDPYAGHSWASGHGGFNRDGNNQESSSEAMNLAYGVIRWGQETGNRSIRDLGIYLYATEQSAIEQYWFDVDGHVFPDGFEHTNVALLWGNGGRYGTRFGDIAPFIHGINVLPVTGGSYYLGQRPEYVARNLAEYESGRTSETWADLMWSFGALSDPTSYWNAFLRQRLLYTPEEGASRSQTYQWMRLLSRLGTVDSAVRANIPGFMVFELNGRRTYFAYNETDENLFARFSDGTRFPIQPRTLGSLQRRSPTDN